MQISNTGLSLIKTTRASSLIAYNCPANDATIGYGHLVHLGPICGAASEAQFAGAITEEQGATLPPRLKGASKEKPFAKSSHAIRTRNGNLVRCRKT